MLFYRPLLAAYRAAELPEIRRFLLRELVNPRLHSEPEETLRCLGSPNDSVGVDPNRFLAELKLSERLLRLRLTSGDLAHEATLGLWTAVKQSRSQVTIRLVRGPSHKTMAKAGEILGPVGQGLLTKTKGEARGLVLTALGQLQQEQFLPQLTAELVSGDLPGSAAIGLTGFSSQDAAAALFSGVQARGLDASAAWLGPSLVELAFPTVIPLVTRLCRSQSVHSREQAAIALESFGAAGIQELLAGFDASDAPVVRLNLLKSIGRVSSGASVKAIRTFCSPRDPEILRVTAIQAAGHAPGSEPLEYLTQSLLSSSPAERAEALEALICKGVTGPAYVEEAYKSSLSDHNRLSLVGLLALVVWDPNRAFDRVMDAFKERSAARWYSATYALRYLQSESSATFLGQICKLAQGTELKEIAVSALARHLHESSVLDLFLGAIDEETEPIVGERIVGDLIRLLPAVRANEAAAVLRVKLDGLLAPSVRGHVLTALGALGTPEDLPLLVSGAAIAPQGAMRGMELLNDPSCIEPLQALAASDSVKVRQTAIVALFRLGHFASVDLLKELTTSSPDAAAQAFFQMALSVRYINHLPRLALLRKALEGLGTSRPSTDPLPSEIPFRGDLDADEEEVLGPPKPRTVHGALGGMHTVTRKHPVPVVLCAPPPEKDPSVYLDLGRHLVGTGFLTQRTSLRAAILVVILLVSLFVVWTRCRRTDSVPGRNRPPVIRSSEQVGP